MSIEMDFGNRGAICSKCGGETGVYDSRPAEFMGAATVRRRRKCDNCGNKFITFEITPDQAELFVKNAVKDVRRKLMDLVADI